MATTSDAPDITDPRLGARNPREQAQRLVEGRFDARVLEPSPPAIDDGDWFADDPTDPAGAERRVVGPTGAADLRWSRWVRDYPEQAAWAAERWLGAYRRLPAPPATLEETRLALHRLAVYVVSPARRRANGKIALRWTLGGFGTPFFGADEQVRVVGTSLVRQAGGGAEAREIGSLNDAAAFVLDGPPDLEWARELAVPPPGALDAPLAIDPEAAAWLGEMYGFAYSVLEELRAEPASTDASRVQLWVEHFDCAFECLDESAGRRAGFGMSPGDDATREPYLYVVPWDFDRAPASDLWNATSFQGAILPFSAVGGERDQRRAALAFLGELRDLLSG